MSFALIGRILKNRLDIKAERFVDAPLRGLSGTLGKLRVGGLIDISRADASFITAVAAGTLLKPPTFSQSLILAYGKIEDHDFRIHRFYFDGPASGSTDTFLQVMTRVGHAGTVDGEVKLFQKLAEINPSEEEWDLWLKGTDETPPMLVGPQIQWQDGVVYERFWEPGAKIGYAKHYTENMESSGNSSACDLTTMLFYRNMNGITEWLQISVVRSGAERWIEAYVGISIDPRELSSI